MTAEAAIKTALESLGVPVGRLTFRGNANTFITYQLIISADRDFSDDESAAMEYTYRINLFSRADYVALFLSMKRVLKAAGFYGIETEAEVYERDTKYFHMPITAKYLEEVEE